MLLNGVRKDHQREMAYGVYTNGHVRKLELVTPILLERNITIHEKQLQSGRDAIQQQSLITGTR